MKASLRQNETGVALVTAILVLALASGLMAGMFAALLANQRSHASDRDQSVAYAAAHAGLEKLTSSLAALFVTDFSPSAAQIAVIDSTPPAITGFKYQAPGGVDGSGYDITFTADPGPGPNTGNPLAFPSTDITTGPFEGFKGLITPYTLTVTARSETGNSEVRLRRELQTVAVPVFQFGIFGEKSLGFHAGPNFDFGGRVHTNQTLYLASGTGSTLTFRDKITAFTQVVRDRISNGQLITATNHTGNVSVPKVIGGAPADYRNLLSTESSGTTASPWAGWKNLSEVTYRTNIRTEATGARQLNLPLTSAGATPIDLIRRPLVNSAENVANAVVYGQRYFAQASLRILLSDRAADITGLPTITGAAPLQLDAVAGPAGYVVGPNRPPVALSQGNEANFNVANGVSWTRVSAVAGAGNGGPNFTPAPAPPNAGATLTIQTWNGAAWANGVPAWMKWNTLTVNGVAVVCTGLTALQLQGCGAHAALANNNPVVFTLVDGTTINATVNGGHAINSATINLNNAFVGPPGVANGASIAQRFVGTRTFYVGEDPVTCNGFTATTLTGCWWAAGTTITANNGAGGPTTTSEAVYSGQTTALNTPLLNGFIKIERQDAAGVWTDVTLELLNLGFAAPNQQGAICADPTPNAVIRLMRLRDNGMAAGQCGVAANNYSGSLNPFDFYPNQLYDAREGSTREINPGNIFHVGGLMGYVAIDMDNFRRWVAGQIGVSGAQTLNNNGYIIYFSDRRGDHNENLVNDPETGEYGFEDSINPGAAAWAKTNMLETGEDFNENNAFDNYGETPHPLAVPATAVANMPFTVNSRPWTTVPLVYSARGRMARQVLFRRALKVVNGGMTGAFNRLPASGVAITSENPVYIQGNFNATEASVTAEPNVPASVIGDSITLLSRVFTDTSTFQFPNTASNRNAVDTGYRFAMITGKTVPFPKPAWSPVNEMGSDGGVHNFMKMLEDWGGTTLRYRGSMVSLYYSRQAIGIYRADSNIYSPPTRGYNFDTDFLSPPLLPPGTPMFRDINTLKFRQILRPNQ